MLEQDKLHCMHCPIDYKLHCTLYSLSEYARVNRINMYACVLHAEYYYYCT